MKYRFNALVTYPSGYTESITGKWTKLIDVDAEIQTISNLRKLIYNAFADGESAVIELDGVMINAKQLAAFEIWAEKRFFGFPIYVKLK